jgi:hypothetical protein
VIDVLVRVQGSTLSIRHSVSVGAVMELFSFAYTLKVVPHPLISMVYGFER